MSSAGKLFSTRHQVLGDPCAVNDVFARARQRQEDLLNSTSAPGMRPSAAGHFEFILKESMIIFKQLPALCVILILIALLLDYLV